MNTSARADSSNLVAYVPAVQAEWLASGDPALWRDVPGSLVFADVSGFTPLTERLAKRGKVGAEELTDVLNNVFTGLLGVAEAYGGDLLKFGGDALLLLFTGSDHAQRAAAGAAGMQAALKPYRRFRTNGGIVSLRMSVGVHTGTFQLFLVGDSHRELLVAGPDSSRTAELEAAADAGEVLLGATTASALDPRHHGLMKEGGTLLRGLPTVEAIPLQRPAADVHTGLSIPVQLREHLQTRHDDGEHRVAVLTFIQFKGTDDLLSAEGPDVVARELDDLVRATQEACGAYGVTFLASDVDKNGGKLLLASGAPTASPDDADRMLHALRAIVLPERRLQVRAGVNRGRAFAVDVGSPVRRTYAVMGDPTNLAARVMGKADNRSILATDAVVAALRDRFHLLPVAPFLVKGKTAPIRAQVIGEALGRVAAGRDLPMLGREVELQRLHAAHDRSQAGAVTSVVISGEPGVGKSRLVDELIASLDQPVVVRAEAAQYAASSPYFAVRAPLRRLIGAPPQGDEGAVEELLDRTVAEMVPRLRPLLPLVAVPFGLSLPDTEETAAIAPAFRRSRMQAAVVELTRALLPPAGVLVVEDAQWMDPASSALVDDLLDGWTGAAWFACVTRRPGEKGYAGPEAAEQLQLEPLPMAARRQLLEVATAAQPLPDHVLDALAERSGGNPLFLGELITTVLSTGVTADLPDNIEALIAGRIDDLLPEERAVLRRAAVLGSRFTGDLLAKLVGVDAHLSVDAFAVIEQLSEFLEADEAGRLRFRQSVVREVAYETLPYRQRRRLHDEAGALIESLVSDVEEFSDLLSLHFLRAQRFAKAWEYARLAGRRARRNAAPVEATELFRRALDAARSLPTLSTDDLVDVQADLAEVAELSGDYEVADGALRAARRMTPPSSTRMVDLCRRSGWLRERAGRYEDALRWYTRGLGVVAEREGDAATLRAKAALTMAYGAARVRQGRYAASIPILDQAVQLAKAADDHATLAHAYYLLDWAHTDLGNPEAAVYRELALPIYEELGDWAGQANVLNNLGVDAYFEGQWDRALELYERSREARGRAGDMVQFVTASNNIGEILSDQGHVPEAEELFREALRAWRAARFPVGIGIALSNLGRAASRSGRHGEAETLLTEASDALRAIGSDALAVEARAREVERRVFAGDGAGALELGRSLASAAADQPVLLAMLQRLIGCALAQVEDVEASRAHLDASLRLGLSASAEFEVALTYEAIARIGCHVGWPDTEDAAERASRLFSQLDVTWTPDLTLLALAGSNEPAR